MVINSDNQVSELIFGAFGDFLTQSGTLGVFAIFAIPSHPGCRGEHQMVINSDNQINDSIIIANVWQNRVFLTDFAILATILKAFWVCNPYSKLSWLQ